MALNHVVLKTLLETAVSSSNLGSKTWCEQTYHDVFSGETLLSTILTDSSNFTSRNSALDYAQNLLDAQVITCITKRRTFDDSDRLYCINRKELETADDKPNIVRADPTNSYEKEMLGKRNSQEINDSRSQQLGSHVKLSRGKTTDMNRVRPSTNLQRLLEKDAAQYHSLGSSIRTNAPASGSNSSAKISHVLKAQPGESIKPKEKNLTANRFEIVLNQPKSEKLAANPPVILQDKLSSSGSRKDVNVSLDPRASETSQCSKENQNIKKTLSPSLSYLIKKDAKNSQSFEKNDSSNDANTNSSSLGDENSSKHHQEKNNWDAFELKLASKVKKSPEKRGSLDTRVNHDVAGSKSSTKNLDVVIENSVQEQEIAMRQFASESRNSKDGNSKGKIILSEKINKTMPCVAVSPGKEAEEISYTSSNSQVNLSVNGDHLVIPSVRARRNSFLGADECNENGEKPTRQRGSSFNDDSHTVVIEDNLVDSIETKFGSREREKSHSFHSNDDVLTNENGIAHNLLAKDKTPSRTLSQNSTNSATSLNEMKSKRPLIKHEHEDAGTTKKSFGKSETVKSNSAGNKNESFEVTLNKHKSIETMNKQTSIEKVGNEKQSNNEVKINGSVMSKSLADLLAKDETLPPEKNRGQSDQNGDKSFYKDKLKELKKTTSYSHHPIGSRNRADISANQNKADVSIVEYQSASEQKRKSSGIVLDENNNMSKSIVANGETEETSQATNVEFQSNCLDINSKKSKISPTNGKIMHIPSGNTTEEHKLSPNQNVTHQKKSSPDAFIPRLNLHQQPNEQSSPISTSSNPSGSDSLVLASSTLVTGKISPSKLREESLDSRESLEKRLEAQKRFYENKITELQLQVDYLRRQNNGELRENESVASPSDVTSLYSPHSTPVVSPGNSTVPSPSLTPQATPRGSVSAENHVISPKSPPPPPPPALPFVPAPPSLHETPVKPNKPVVNPKTEMKPLFWNRIIASNASAPKRRSVWKKIKEPTFDTNEFERLFSKKNADRKLKRTKSLRDDKHFAHINGKKVVKLLETNRSRAIGIKMSSLNCQLEDIRNAVYNMDTSVVDLESLQSIYDIYPRDEEVQLIEDHLKKSPEVPLDKPEEFMKELTKMKHFKERLECWLFQDKFSEVICSIERSLGCVTESCKVLTTNSEIAVLLGLVLAYGNYMNGNTARGQADGFHLEVLLKLRDVKAKDSDLNLLQYTVKQYLKQYERCSDKNKNESRLPSPVSLSNAAQVSFHKLREELVRMSKFLDETEAQVKQILDECSLARRNPFENKMIKFQSSAKQKIAEEKDKMAKAEQTFRDAVEYFRWELDGKKETPEEFFGLWAKFIEEVKSCVKLEKQQRELAKKNFSKVEHLSQIREAATKMRKRRQSVDMLP